MFDEPRSEQPDDKAAGLHGRRETVVARNISKTFGSTKALDNVSIVGFAGAVHAITGENGAGKSTLMKILSRNRMGGRYPCTGNR